jgi:hypothetical protein
MAAPKKSKPKMTNAHKAALAEGRAESLAVRRYLEALEATKPSRGRKRTTASVEARLATIERDIATADPLRRVQLIQERLDLQQELETAGNGIDVEELQAGFIESAAGYSQRKGISYAAWRELGVAPAVLKAAGVGRAG